MSQVLIQQALGETSGYQNILPTNITSEVANMFVNSNGAQYTNDVLKYLGKYCMYWWKRRKRETITTGTETKISSGIYFGSGYTLKYSYQLMTESDLISKGTSITMGSTETANTKIAQQLVSLASSAPIYVTAGYGTVYKIPAGATFSTTYSSTLTLYMETSSIILNSSGSPYCSTVTDITTTTQYTDWEYLQSTGRNAYPDSGTLDEYEYQFLNVPFENSLMACKIQTGSYVGTGTYGSENPNILTFDSQPLVVLFPYSYSSSYITYSKLRDSFWYFCSSGNTIHYNSASAYADLKVEWGLDYVKWYTNTWNKYNVTSTKEEVQLNSLEQIYNYIAFLAN